MSRGPHQPRLMMAGEKGKMMELINLTPHDIHIMDEHQNVLWTLKASGIVARCNEEIEMTGRVVLDELGELKVPLYSRKFLRVNNLPPVTENRTYVLTSYVKIAHPERADLLVASDMVRTEGGRIIGCRSFTR